MPIPTPTPPTISTRQGAKDNTEVHDSWITVRANRIQTTGQHLFQSDIVHREYVCVTISSCSRTRDLKHDWVHSEDTLLEFNLSMAQWGAFVSSFGQGGGVPATLGFVGKQMPVGDEFGYIAGSTHEARLAVSIAEVRNAADEMLESVTEAQEALSEAIARNAGRKEMKELGRNLEIAVQNAKSNVVFTAKSLTEHAENVTEKMRADVEALVLQHAATLGLDSGDFTDAIPALMAEG